MILKTILRWLKPSIRRWLAERALVLPESERLRIARGFKLDPIVVEAVEIALREAVLEAFDRL